MIYTGTTIRYFTATDKLSFIFKDCFVDAKDYYNASGTSLLTGQAVTIGFSGITGQNKISFLFSGGKIYDPEGRNIYCYDENLSFNFSGNIGADTYEYFVDNQLICSIGQRDVFDINMFYISGYNGGNIETSPFIYIDDMTTSLVFQAQFIESGYWTGYYKNALGNKPIVIRSGELIGGDAIYFSIYSGLSFNNGENVLSGNQSRTVILQQTSGARNTGVFNLGLRIYTDFGYDDFSFSGKNIPASTLQVINTLAAVGPSGATPTGSGLTAYKEYYYNTYAVSGGSPLTKNIYIEVSYFSGYTGYFNAVTGFAFSASGGGYVNDFHGFYIEPISNGFGPGYGYILTNNLGQATGVRWAHPQTDTLGVYYSGSSADKPYAAIFAVEGGYPSATGELTFLPYIKNFSGMFDVITGTYGANEVSFKSLGQYDATKFSGFTTLSTIEENFFVKIAYTALYDYSPIYFTIRISGLRDTITNSEWVSGEAYGMRWSSESPLDMRGNPFTAYWRIRPPIPR